MGAGVAEVRSVVLARLVRFPEFAVLRPPGCVEVLPDTWLVVRPPAVVEVRPGAVVLVRVGPVPGVLAGGVELVLSSYLHTGSLFPS